MTLPRPGGQFSSVLMPPPWFAVRDKGPPRRADKFAADPTNFRTKEVLGPIEAAFKAVCNRHTPALFITDLFTALPLPFTAFFYCLSLPFLDLAPRDTLSCPLSSATVQQIEPSSHWGLLARGHH